MINSKSKINFHNKIKSKKTAFNSFPNFHAAHFLKMNLIFINYPEFKQYLLNKVNKFQDISFEPPFKNYLSSSKYLQIEKRYHNFPLKFFAKNGFLFLRDFPSQKR